MTYTEDRPDARESQPDTVWGRFAPIVLRLHFYAGLLVGPFLLIAALTGLAYALVGQVDAAVYRHELKVDSVGPSSCHCHNRCRWRPLRSRPAR